MYFRLKECFGFDCFFRFMRPLFFMVAALSVVSWSAHAADYNPLPDTGQDTCYDGAGNVIDCPPPGDPMAQDGSYYKVQQSFTDNGDGTVTDNNTGLMWQKADDGVVRTWYQAIDYCRSLNFVGFEDWRLPTLFELTTIVNYGHYNPAIDTTVFSCRSSIYWSATMYAYYSDYAWGVNLSNGNANTYSKTGLYYACCVRGGL